VNVKAGHPKTL